MLMFRPFKCSWSHILGMDAVVFTVMTELFIKGNFWFAALLETVCTWYECLSGAVVFVNILFSCYFSSF